MAAVVPYPGFGRVELDVCMLLQFVGKGAVCCFNSVGGDDEVDVVEVGIQAFPGLQVLLCVCCRAECWPHEKSAGMRGSPCSPPSA